MSAVVCGLSMIKYKLVSSVNNFNRRLYVYNDVIYKNDKKNSGLRIDPWGTPALMKPQSDDALLITIRCFLPNR